MQKETNTIQFWAIYSTGVVLLLLLLFFKITKYNLFYYQEDVFSCYQLTQSWYKGRGILWEPMLGNYVSQHNFYFALVLFPITFLLGVKGLFVAHILLLLAAWHVWAFTSKTKTSLLTGLVLLCGPFSLYLVEDSAYGWHFELLFFPLGILFAKALQTKKFWLQLISGLAISLVKEDGAVVACCIHLFWAAHKIFLTDEKVFAKKNLLKLIRLTGFWLLIFVGGIALLKLQNVQTNWRGIEAIAKFTNDTFSNQSLYIAKLFFSYLLFMVPLLLLVFIFFGRKYFFLLLACLVPIIIIELISGMFYYPSLRYSLTYPPRLAQSMAVVGSALLILFSQEKIISDKFKNNTKIVILLVAFLLQLILLRTIREYDLTADIKNVLNGNANGVTRSEQRLLKCLATAIPTNKAVVVPDYLYSTFEKHDFYWKEHPENFLTQPDVFILKDSADAKLIPYLDNYHYQKKKGFYLFIKKESGIDISGCR